MIRKILAIRCNKCYNIVVDNGECYCKAIALIKINDKMFIYTDDEDYSFVIVYVDGKGRRLKVIDMDLLKKVSVVLPTSDAVLCSILPKNFLKGD